MRKKETPLFWITGLSGAGKSTLAATLSVHLASEGLKPIMLDGDELRDIFQFHGNQEEMYDRANRLELAFRYGRLAYQLINQGFPVIVSPISLFKEIHQWNRDNIPGYTEIYLKVSKQELRRRDPKGLYDSFDKGDIINIAGFDLDVDEPATPDFLIDTDEYIDVNKLAKQIIKRFFV